MKIALITDLHFGVHRSSDVFLNSQKQFLYDQFLPYCKEQKINHVIIPGDVFDSRNSINVKIFNEAFDFFKDLSEIVEHIYVLLGNHDLFYNSSYTVNSLNYLPDISNVSLIRVPTQIKIDKKEFFLVPWILDYDKFVEEVKTDSSEVCIGHFDIFGFSMNNLKKSDEGINPKIFNKYNKVFSGHFHSRSIDKIDTTEFIYIGTPYAMSRDDVLKEKGFCIYDTETNDYEFVENVVSLKYISIHYPEQYDKEMIDGNIVDVIVDYDKDYKEEEFREYLEEIQNFNPIGNVNVKIESNFLSGESAELKDIGNMNITTMMDNYINDTNFDDVKKKQLTNLMNELYEEITQ